MADGTPARPSSTRGELDEVLDRIEAAADELLELLRTIAHAVMPETGTDAASIEDYQGKVRRLSDERRGLSGS